MATFGLRRKSAFHRDLSNNYSVTKRSDRISSSPASRPSKLIQGNDFEESRMFLFENLRPALQEMVQFVKLKSNESSGITWLKEYGQLLSCLANTLNSDKNCKLYVKAVTDIADIIDVFINDIKSQLVLLSSSICTALADSIEEMSKKIPPAIKQYRESSKQKNTSLQKLSKDMQKYQSKVDKSSSRKMKEKNYYKYREKASKLNECELSISQQSQKIHKWILAEQTTLIETLVNGHITLAEKIQNVFLKHANLITERKETWKSLVKDELQVPEFNDHRKDTYSSSEYEDEDVQSDSDSDMQRLEISTIETMLNRYINRHEQSPIPRMKLYVRTRSTRMKKNRRRNNSIFDANMSKSERSSLRKSQEHREKQYIFTREDVNMSKSERSSLRKSKENREKTQRFSNEEIELPQVSATSGPVHSEDKRNHPELKPATLANIKEISQKTDPQQSKMSISHHKYKALYSHCPGSSGKQLEFDVNDVILVIENCLSANGWLYGKNCRTKSEGWFPESFTEKVISFNESQNDDVHSITSANNIQSNLPDVKEEDDSEDSGRSSLLIGTAYTNLPNCDAGYLSDTTSQSEENQFSKVKLRKVMNKRDRSAPALPKN